MTISTYMHVGSHTHGDPNYSSFFVRRLVVRGGAFKRVGLYYPTNHLDPFIDICLLNKGLECYRTI